MKVTRQPIVQRAVACRAAAGPSRPTRGGTLPASAQRLVSPKAVRILLRNALWISAVSSCHRECPGQLGGRLSSESATSFAESVCVTLCAAYHRVAPYEAVRRPLPAGRPQPAKQERQLGCWLPGSTWMVQSVNQAALHRELKCFSSSVCGGRRAWA